MISPYTFSKKDQNERNSSHWSKISHNSKLANSLPPEVVFPFEMESRMVRTQENFSLKFKNPQNSSANILKIQNLQGKNVNDMMRFTRLR